MGPLAYALTLDSGGFDRPLGASRSALSSFTSAAGTATGALTGLLAPVLALVGPVAAVGVGFKAWNAAADLEQTRIALRTLIGDVEKADALLQKVRVLGASTPFQFPELANSTRMLAAFGEEAKDIPNVLRRIGDVASGVQAPITELAELYGKARTQGTLYAEDLNQLTGRGIPILDELAKIMGVNVSQVKKLASEGKLTFPLLEQAFINLTAEGGKFFGMMEQQAETGRGLLSTLKDSLNEILIVVGQPVNDMLKPMLTGAIEKSKLLGIQVQGLVELFREAGSQGQIGQMIGSSLQLGAVKFINTLAGGIRGSVAFLGAALPEVLGSAKDVLFGERSMLVIESVFGGAADLLRGALFAGAATLARVLHMKGLGQELQDTSDHEVNRAGNRFRTARAGLEFADAGGAVQGITDAMAKGLEKGAAAFDSASDFKIFDEGPALDQWKDVAEKLNPESAAKVLDPEKFLPEGFEREAGAKAKGLDAALDKMTQATKENTTALKAGKPTEKTAEDKKRGGVLSAAESLAARFGRRSTADRKEVSFDDFVNGSAANRAAVSKFANANGLSFDEALDKLNPASSASDPRKKKSTADDRAASQTSAMLEVVRAIDSKLENLAVA